MITDGISYGLRARAALESNGFKCTHSLGQNFILDERVLEHLLKLAGVGTGDNVLEIGPGPGVLTALMAERADRVYSIEADEKLKPVLERTLQGFNNIEVLFADALRANIGKIVAEEFGGKYRVVANLPYYITADLIQKMILTIPAPESICVMVQREAADRLQSMPGAKNWCAFAAIVRYFGNCEVLDTVPADVFDPAPHVESCFIRININNARLLPADDERGLVRLIKCCFAMRRKTLANNLKAGYNISLQEGTKIIESAGFPPQVRGEALEIDEIVHLYKCLQEFLQRS